MLTIKQCRELIPELEYLTDEELNQLILDLYGVGQLALDSWLSKKRGSKIPFGSLPEELVTG